MPIKEMQQTVKQHAVPQNIMQVEFKVIGELTMRQFFYLVIGTIFAFGALKSGLPSIIRLPIVVAIVGGSLAIAFLPVQERGLDVWVVNFFKAIYSPTLRVWRKEISPPSYFSYQNADIIKSEMMAIAPTASRRKLERYLERETKEALPDIIDLREAEYIKKIREAYGEPIPATTVLQTTQQYVTTPMVVAEPTTFTSPIPTPIQPVDDRKTRDKKLQSEPNVQADNKALQAQPALGETQAAQKPQTNLQANPEEVRIRATAFSTPFKPTKQSQIKTPYSQAPMSMPVTPDRLTGRRFTQLFKTEGEITLPIKGERVLKTSKELSEEEIQEDINEKANKLMDLVARIKKDENKTKKEIPVATYKVAIPSQQKVWPSTASSPVQVVETLPKVTVLEKPFIPASTSQQSQAQTAPQTKLQDVSGPDTERAAHEAMESLKSENEQLVKQIDSLKMLVGSTSTKTETEKYEISEKIKLLQEQKSLADSKIETLNKQVEELKQMLAQKAVEPTKVVVQKIVKEVEVPVIRASDVASREAQKPNIIYSQPQSKISPLTNIPNVINGIIKDSNQKLVESAVVIIEDARGDTVRALRTNRLGQFAITTPVSNGTYIIKVSKDELGIKFDVISVEVKGEVLPPIELTGRL